MTEPWPCTEDPELWFAGDAASKGEAVHVCLTHCPILAQCRGWARANPPAGGIQAGVVYTMDRVPDRHSQPVVHRCDRCPPLPTSEHVGPEPVIAKPPTQTGVCGKPAGFYRHYRRGEKPCEPCRVAVNAHQREKARKAS